MTTGVPLYLVSACASAEEFVAAFRRYADKTGVFVPIGEPLPQGRRGRIALTLKDGGVMIEGEAEVISSSTKPSGLYGRVGMTVKFVELDEPSKAVISDLEKARLAMRPPPPSVPARPATVPAAPRPVPPALGGRIDAANALAECVLIGDASVLKQIVGDANKSGANKFAIPTIPAMGGPARPKTPSTPPALTARPKTPSVPPPTPAFGVPKATTHGMPAIDRLPAPETKATSVGMPAIEPAPKTTSLGMAPMAPKPPPTPVKPAAPVVVAEDKPRADATVPLLMKTPPAKPPTRSRTPSTAPPRQPTPFAPLPIVVRKPALDAAPAEEKTDLTNVPAVVIAKPPVETPDEEESGYVGPPPRPPGAAVEDKQKPNSRSGGLRASEIMAAIPPTDDWTMTPDASAPTVIPAEAKPAAPGAKPPPPTGDWTIAADPSAADGWTPPSKVEPLPPPKQPATGNRVIAIASAMPLEAVEWEEKPTGIGEPLVQIDPTLMEPLKPMPADEPAGSGELPAMPFSPAGVPPPGMPMRPAPMAGAAPMGGMPPAPMQPIAGMPPAMQPMHGGGMPPAPMQPIAGMPPAPMQAMPGSMPPPPVAPMPPPGVPPPLAPMPPGVPPPLGAMPMSIPTPPPGSIPNLAGVIPTPPPGSIPTPPPMANPLFAHGIVPPGANQAMPPGMNGVAVLEMTSRPRADLTDAGTGFFRESGELPRYPTESTDAIQGGRKRTLVIAISAALAVAIVLVVVVFAFGGGGKKPRAGGAHAGSSTPVAELHGSGSALVTVGSGSAGSAAEMVQPPTGSNTVTPPPVDAGVAAPSQCSVEVTSTPPGAEVAIDKTTVLGTTPTTIELPCGVETKLYVKKSRLATVVKTFTPSAENTKLSVKLQASMFSIKVTSMPAGATITVGGRVLGITPTTIRLPAFSTTSITLSKDGFLPDTQKLAPRANNAAHHVNLKKGRQQKLR